MSDLSEIMETLSRSTAVRDKIEITAAYAPAGPVRGGVRLGDDCAAIPVDGSHLLLAAEGMLADFVAEDPWFAGYSAVMVNVSDVVAMGGRPLAITDVVWTPDHAAAADVWDGLRSASGAYGVPIVGGHTTLTRSGDSVMLAAAVLGRAQKLLTSFDAEPGDVLFYAVDLDGGYRGDKPFWNASTSAPPQRLRALNELLPRIAERGLCRAAKDVSNGGVIGTLVMLLQCSGVGATLDLDALPRPEGVDLGHWLTSFPSFGHLLALKPDTVDDVRNLFQEEEIATGIAGRVDRSNALTLRLGGESELFWSIPEATHA